MASPRPAPPARHLVCSACPLLACAPEAGWAPGALGQQTCAAWQAAGAAAGLATCWLPVPNCPAGCAAAAAALPRPPAHSSKWQSEGRKVGGRGCHDRCHKRLSSVRHAKLQQYRRNAYGLPATCLACQQHVRLASSMPGLPAACLACQQHIRLASSMPGLPAACLACQQHAWLASSMPGLPAACQLCQQHALIARMLDRTTGMLRDSAAQAGARVCNANFLRRGAQPAMHEPRTCGIFVDIGLALV
eukprot:365291-Chlamydomonas_euryale.AAC.17